jgi:hypothetical protein
MDWFWMIYGGGIGLVAVLIWIAEFSGMKLGSEKKKKSMWRQSKDRIHQQQYGASTHYSAGRTHHIRRKGM